MDKFTTVSNPKRIYIKTCVIFWLVLAILGCLALLSSLETFIIAQGTILVIMIITLISLLRNNVRWQLDFEGDRLRITNLSTKEEHEVWSVTVDEFDLRQNKRQLKADVGDFGIGDTIFKIPEVQNFSALKEYINTHFATKQQ